MEIASGAVTAAFGGGGPIITTYFAIMDWSRDEIKAALVAYFLVGNAMTALAHAVVGLTDIRLIGLLAVSLLPMFGGV